MKQVAALVLAPVLLAGGAVMNTSVLLVDVQQADGPDIVVPVPLPVARAALALVPEEGQRVEARDVAEHLEHAEWILEELRGAPDGVYVEIYDDGEYVRVAKEGDVLRLQAIDGDDALADVRLPLRSMDAVLRAYDRESGSFRTSDLLSALEAAPDGQLVHVLDGEHEVRIRMW